MVSVDPAVITHKLTMNSCFIPIQHKRRRFAPKRDKIIVEEVKKLIDARIVREVRYPEWLANVVVVQKKN